MRATYVSLMLAVVMLVLLPVGASAQCSGAITDYALLNAPAGWTAYGTFAGGASQSFGVQVTLGHSYTLTVLEYGSSTGKGLDFAVAPVTTFPTGTVLDVSGVDPILTTATTGAGTTTTYGQRFAFIAPSTGTVSFCLTNSDTTNINYATLIAAETTLVSTRWESYVGYTSWGFLNTTGASVTGYLSLFDSTGTQVGSTAKITIPASASVFADTIANGSDTNMNTPANKAGSAFFAPLAPYGAVVADAFMLQGGGVTLPVPFVPVARGSGGF